MKTLLVAALVKARALSRSRSTRALTSAATLLATAAAQQVSQAPAAGVLGKGAETLYGPVVATAVELPGEKPEVITRGIVVRAADDRALAYDITRMTVPVAWTGKFLGLKRTNLGTYKGLGDGAAVPLGELVPKTTIPTLLRAGSRQELRFRGIHVHGRDVVFSYSLGGAEVLDSCMFTNEGEQHSIYRRLSIGPRKSPVLFRLFDAVTTGNARTLMGEATNWWVIEENGGTSIQCVSGNEWIHLHIESSGVADRWSPSINTLGGQIDLRTLTKGGPANWPQTITVAGKRAPDDAAYVVDTIPLPDDNPWRCWLRPTGLDFLPDGRLALCTLGGDVWIASGVDDSLAKVTWRRFAGGLREPMGLRVVGGKIHVGCRDQITRLHDLNADGEADFYECVNDGRTLVANFHAFAYDLQTDRAGNFYYGTGGNQLGPDEPWHGPLFRVSADGKQLSAFAKGFRAPNGLTISPDDAIYVAENQGNWIPSSKISRIREGGFYGYVAAPTFKDARAPATFDLPLCYIPHAWDGSSGGGAFCTSEKWGPFRGRMLHTSFGSAALFAVFEQRVGEVSNGAVVKFPLAFESGIHRARFGPDGQLYVVGTKGWQSKAIRDGCLARVRFTGKPVTLPTNWRVEKNAVVIEFATPLDRASAEDTENFAAQQWNYKWHSTYGSPDVSVADPKRQGRDTVEVKAARLSTDGKTVKLEIPGLAPVMQFLVKMNVNAADGSEVRGEIAGTINRVP
jgi:glucose/arabinose dehydrogenase